MIERRWSNPDGVTPFAHEAPTLATAIADRMIKERLQLDAIRGKTDGTFPFFFLNSVRDSYAKTLEPVLKAPSPYADFFTRSDAILDHIPSEDWQAFAVHQGVSCSPRQVEWMFRAQIIAHEGIETRIPEERFNNFMEILNNAVSLAASSGKTPAEIFNDDTLYEELIRMSIPMETYEKERLELAETKTVKNIAVIQARKEMLFKQITDFPEEVEEDGFSLDNRAVKKLAKKKKKNMRKQLEKTATQEMDEDLEKVIFLLNRFWGKK